MAQLEQSLVTLRISGDALVPAELSALLGVEPTLAHAKGEEIASARFAGTRVAATGMWHLRASDSEPADLDAQVRELLAKLPGELPSWRRLRERFHIDLYCGLLMGHANETLALSPQTLVALGVRGIELGLDLYAPHVDAALDAAAAVDRVDAVAAVAAVVTPGAEAVADADGREADAQDPRASPALPASAAPLPRRRRPVPDAAMPDLLAGLEPLDPPRA